MWRRKIFLENIYMPYFFDAYIFYKRVTVRKNKDLLSYDDSITKVDILKAYWVKILNCPMKKEELFDSMANESSLNKETYEECYNKKYSLEKYKYIELIKKEFKKNSIIAK